MPFPTIIVKTSILQQQHQQHRSAERQPPPYVIQAASKLLRPPRDSAADTPATFTHTMELHQRSLIDLPPRTSTPASILTRLTPPRRTNQQQQHNLVAASATKLHLHSVSRSSPTKSGCQTADPARLHPLPMLPWVRLSPIYLR